MMSCLNTRSPVFRDERKDIWANQLTIHIHGFVKTPVLQSDETQVFCVGLLTYNIVVLCEQNEEPDRLSPWQIPIRRTRMQHDKENATKDVD